VHNDLLTQDDVRAAAAGAGSVVVGRAFLDFCGLEAQLASRFPFVVDAGSVSVYVRRRPPPRDGGSMARPTARSGRLPCPS
jgi:hypothetical protein